MAAFVVKVTFIILSVSATILVFYYPKFAILNGFWQIDAASSSYLGPKGRREPHGSSRKVKDQSQDESDRAGLSRWSRRGSFFPKGSRTDRSGSLESNMKALATYAKQQSWYGGSSSSNHDDKTFGAAAQRRVTAGTFVDYENGGISAPATPINLTSSGASNDGESQDAEKGAQSQQPVPPREGTSEPDGGTAAMFFGLRVVS